MATFVLVPGAWHGSWAFEAVVPLLERAGHTVHALTLTGLRPDDDNVTVATANLDTHADDVLRLLDRAHVTSATLVGHSYAGMVIAAAADRARGRVSRLVHLDAYVPRDGESCWSSTTEQYRQAFVAGAAATGYAVRPPFRQPDGGDPRRRPHPIASLLQTIRLTSTLAQVPRREFIYCSGWEDRTSLNSAPGSKLIQSGKSTTSQPPTTRCVMPRIPSPHCCLTSAPQTHRRQGDRLAREVIAGRFGTAQIYLDLYTFTRPLIARCNRHGLTPEGSGLRRCRRSRR